MQVCLGRVRLGLSWVGQGPSNVSQLRPKQGQSKARVEAVPSPSEEAVGRGPKAIGRGPILRPPELRTGKKAWELRTGTKN